MRTLSAFLVCLAFAAAALAAAPAPAPAPVKLWRLDCGALQESDLNDFSDIEAYTGQSRHFTVSCYLIQHGDTYMLWDTGLPDEDLGLPLEGPRSTGETVSKLLPDELAAIGVKPQQIAIVGISHYHTDHTGQAHHFPQARLLIGKGDIVALRTGTEAFVKEHAKPLEHWLNGGAKLEEVDGDKDVFKDNSVVMLSLPGHTAGHHGLLVRLAGKGAVLLSGDVAHFRENYENSGVPKFNVDRAQSLASIDRFKGLAKNLHATVVIQHETGDIGKLPAFPNFAQ
ncbi:MAG: N-acyl homoserine lactonase family protein [Proteobacteria bacterium]|nr:N-acyl homoserine lactonase family protein [Pseudomonadota bacterium]